MRVERRGAVPVTSESVFTAKVLLVLEAFFGGFYVSITRGLFVTMLAYSGYSFNMISATLLPAGLGGLVLANELYHKPETVAKKFRLLLLSSHVAERVVWLLPPFLLQYPHLLSADYMAGNMISLLVSLLLAALIYASFPTREVVEVSVHRSAAGSAASILGSLFMTYFSAVQPAPQVFTTLYVTAFLAGLASSATLLLMPRIPPTLPGEGSAPTEHLEVKVKSVVVLVALTFLFAGSNLVGVAWSPLLQQRGAPVYVPLAITLAGNLGGLVGAYFWRSYRAYLVAISLNTLLTCMIPYLPLPPLHVLASFLASMTFAGANLLGMQVFAELNERMGRVRASAFLVAANYSGLLLASALSAAGFLTPFTGLLVAALFKLAGVLVALLAIPETAVVPERKAYEYSRLIYTTGVMGYTFTVQASREFFKTAVEVLALTVLLILLYTIYRVAWLFIGV